jgi:putative inorganic carbon (HCO3(-)) transporter
MFIVFHSFLQLVLLVFGLAIFCAIAWRRFDLGLGLILFLAPTYIFKFSIFGLPQTVLEVLILAVFFIWLIKKIRAKQLSGSTKSFKEYQEFWLPVFLILEGALVSTLLSPDIKASAGIFKSWLLEPAIFALVLLDTVKTKEQIRKLLLFLVFSGVAQSLIALLYWFLGRLTFDGRLSAFYLSPNHLAMALAPCLILSAYFLSVTKDFLRRAMFFAAIFVQAAVLYLTLSYAAWLAIFAALVVAVSMLWRTKTVSSKKAFGICGILLIIGTVFLFSQFGSEKLYNLLNSDRSSWQSRLMVWQAAIKIIGDNWFFGIGPGMFQKNYLDYQKYFSPYLEWAVPQPQNIFLAFWLQTGLVGLAGFIWLILIFFKRTLGIFSKIKPSYTKVSEGRQPLALVLAAVIIYILAHGLLDTPFWKNDLALIFLTIAALGYKVTRLSDW